MITYQREEKAGMLDDAMELIVRHCREVEPYPDIQPTPNRVAAEFAADAGILQVYSVRDDGRLVGYETFIVSFHLHYAQSKRALQDAIYLLPEYRGSTALSLIRFSDLELQKQGVQVVMRAEKRLSPYGALLVRTGHEHHENLWIKRLDRVAEPANIVPLPRLRPSPVSEHVPDVPKSLHDFAAWYFDGGIKLKPPHDGLLFQQRPGTSITSVVLYREGRYQVEMIIIAPGSIAPKHRHDHIDSIEVKLSGAFSLIIDGKLACNPDLAPRRNGMARDVLRSAPVASHAAHGGVAGDLGGCFLSVQEWKGMNPTHVGIEWQDDNNLTFSQGA